MICLTVQIRWYTLKKDGNVCLIVYITTSYVFHELVFNQLIFYGILCKMNYSMPIFFLLITTLQRVVEWIGKLFWKPYTCCFRYCLFAFLYCILFFICLKGMLILVVIILHVAVSNIISLSDNTL
jgi:hypothetical protein